jgi:hypothetical protein
MLFKVAFIMNQACFRGKWNVVDAGIRYETVS